AAAGEKRSGGNSPNLSVSLPSPGSQQQLGQGNDKPANPSSATDTRQDTSVVLNNSSTGVPGGSEVYKISSDGAPTRLWSSHDDLVYALAFDERGHLLAGTGNQGQVFQISGREEYCALLKAAANQVTAFTSASGGLYASTSTLGKIFLLSNTPDSEGNYESDVFDARVFSKWGRAEFRGTGNVELFARSGNVDNPDRNWSTW